MIVEDVGPEDMRGDVGAALGERRDVVVPSEVECWAANQCSPRDAWMFSCAKQLRDRLQDALGRRRRPVMQSREPPPGPGAGCPGC